MGVSRMLLAPLLLLLALATTASADSSRSLLSSAGDHVQDNVTKQILYLTLPHLFKSVKRGHENTRGFDMNEKKIRNRILPKVKPEIMEVVNIFTTTHQPASIRAI